MRLALAALALLLAPAPTWAQTGTSSRALARPVSGGDLAAVAFMSAGLITGALSFDAPPRRVSGPWLFDQGARSLLAGDNEDRRVVASTISDVLQAGLAIYPAIDAGLSVGARRGNGRLLGEVLVIEAESYLFTGMVTLLTKNLVGRERPYAAGCSAGSCGSASRNKSFISGHAATSFTAAGLTCALHGRLDLYGDALADGAACGAALVVATVASALRVVSDEHWATDVLAGALVGLISGYLLPRLLHLDAWLFEDEPRP